MTTKHVLRVLRLYGFSDGRMISHSKMGYIRRNPDHFVVFNAQLFSDSERIIKQADLDLTLEGQKLTEAARALGQSFYVLLENDPTPFWKPGDKPVSAILREAVWWTRCRPKDEDRFLPVASGPLWTKQARLRCVTGEWKEQPAYSVDLWGISEWQSLRNYCGAAVQLTGHPPQGFRSTEQKVDFAAQVSLTRGRSVRPLFYQRSGFLSYVWFSHGAAIPAVLYDQTLRSMEGLSFTVHQHNSAIHLRRSGKVVGLCRSAGILAPEVVENARAELKRLSAEANQERACQGSKPTAPKQGVSKV